MLYNSKYLVPSVYENNCEQNSKQNSKQNCEQNKLIKLSDVNNDFSNQIEILNENKKQTYDKSNTQLKFANKKLFIENTGNEDKIKNKDTKYNPYYDYLFSHGLLNNTSVNNYSIYYVNIDSSARNKMPYGIYGSSVQLSKNSLKLIRGSNIISVYNPKHKYVVNDRVSLSNIFTLTAKLMTYGYIDIDVENVNTGALSTNRLIGNTFEIIPNTKFMKIYYSHQLFVENNSVFNGSTYDFLNDTFYETFDISKLTVNISNIRSNLYDAQTGSHFDNIPLVMINNQHNIIIKDPFDGKIRRNIFYIELKKKYEPINGIFQTPNPQYAFSISFNYVGGIPINLLNTGYPISINFLNGYHEVSSIIEDVNKEIVGYTINLNAKSCGIIDFSTYSLNTDYNCGGNNIVEKEVLDIIKGYIDPNHYKIHLPQAYTNVISVKLLSSEIPNVEPVIKSNQINISENNNKLYWQNIDDGDYIYSLSINSGIYDLVDLKTVLQETFYNIPRIYYNRDNLDNTFSNQITPSYTNHNYVIIVVNPSTGVIQFKSYRELFLFKPIIAITPEIPLDYTQDQDILINYVLTIRHPNHGVNVGDNILLSNVVDTMGISTNVLSSEHIISAVLDKDTYQITLPATNLSTTRNDVKGGVNVGIYVPNLMRFRFDFKDTMGSLLGFRDIGKPTSITDYKFPLSNNDAYYNELTLDDNGDEKKIGPYSINLASYNYILIVCNQIQTMTSVGSIKNAFAKILLSDTPQKIVYNSFVNMTSYIDLNQLTELEFFFYTPSGKLYDFDGLDNSFTLEIKTLNNIPENTNINSLTGI